MLLMCIFVVTRAGHMCCMHLVLYFTYRGTIFNIFLQPMGICCIPSFFLMHWSISMLQRVWVIYYGTRAIFDASILQLRNMPMHRKQLEIS
jgi:hypothetical protein